MTNIYGVCAASLAITTVLTTAVNYVNILPWHCSRDAHWTERARLLWPARIAANRNGYLVPAFVTLLLLVCGVTWSAVPFLVLASLIGVAISGYWINRLFWPEYPAVKNCVLHVLELEQLVLPFAAICAAMYLDADWIGTFAIVLAPAVISRILLVKPRRWLLLRTGIMCPPSERLLAIVARSAETAGQPVPVVWEMDLPETNAWAYLLSRELRFSRSLLEVCTDDEVAAICAHELEHLAEPRWSGFVRVARQYTSYLFILAIPLVQLLGGWVVVVAILGVSMIHTVVARFRHRMEERADRAGADAEMHEGVYAQALEKLYQKNLTPVVLPYVGTHPHLYDRMVNAGVEPAYPRPDPPLQRMLSTRLLRGACLILSGLLIARAIAGG